MTLIIIDDYTSLASNTHPALLCCTKAVKSARRENVALGGQVVLSVSASSDLPLWKISGGSRKSKGGVPKVDRTMRAEGVWKFWSRPLYLRSGNAYCVQSELILFNRITRDLQERYSGKAYFLQVSILLNQITRKIGSFFLDGAV